LFNRTLVLQRLYLTSAAITAWERFLDIATTSPWTEEAFRRLEDLKTPWTTRWDQAHTSLTQTQGLGGLSAVELAREFPQQVTDFAENALISRWSDAATRTQDDEADRLLDLLLALGTALHEVTGDPMVAETAQAIVSAPRDRRLSLAHAHGIYARAKALYDDRSVGSASELFGAAASELESAGSPYHYWALYYLAVADYWSADTPHAASQLQRLSEKLAAAGYPRAQGYVAWMDGLIHIDAGRFSEGIADYRLALERFEATGMHGLAASIRVLLGDALTRLGEPLQAWDMLHPALDAATHFAQPLWVKQVYEEAAEALAAAGYPHVAIVFQQQALEAALSTQVPSTVAEGLYELALAQSQLGLEAEAHQGLQEARRWLSTISDPDTYRRIDAGISWVEGLVSEARQEPKSIQQLTESIDFFTESKMEVLLPPIYLQRARLYLGRGNDAAAELDLRQATELAERQRTAIDEARWRVSFTNTARQALELLIGLYLDQQRPPEEVIPLTERLRDAAFFAGAEAAADTISGYPWSDALPADTAVVSLTVLEDRLVTWVYRSGHADLTQVSRPRRELRLLVDAVGDLRKPMAVTEEARSALYDALFAPVASHLAGARTLVIVPDVSLILVPFAALYDRSAGQLLIERHSVVITPSANLFLATPASQEGPVVPRSHEVGIVGDPRLDLPFAESEARALGTLFGSGAKLLIHHEATKDNVIELLQSSRIFHFGGHAVANLEHPEAARLVLHGDAPGRPVGLFAAEIRALNLRNAQLVVLSACEAARTSERDASGILSLYSPFLAAGARYVVANQVAIDDETGYEVSVMLHEAVLAGMDPADSLREAQIAYLKIPPHTKPDCQWAGFRIVTTSHDRMESYHER